MHRNQPHGIFRGGCVTHVGHVLLLAHVYHQIIRTGILANDHAFVHILLCTDEQSATLLGVEQTIGGADAGFVCHQSAHVPVRNVTLHGLIPFKGGGHNAFATGIGHEFAAIAEQATGRHQEL